MNAVIYARYSSDRQTEDSIEAQLRACREYASAKNISIVGIYKDEAVSGKGSKTSRRLQYQKMLRDCAKGTFSMILVHKYDRIARSMVEHINLSTRLQSFGIDLVATAQDFGHSNESKIMRSLIWSLSEYYIDNLADEVKKGHRENALKALHNGGCPPFGYDVVDRKYIINELEAGYVRRIFQCAANREGFVNILAEMSQAGIIGKRGKPVRYTQVYEMLRNEKYTGTYVYSPKMPHTRADRSSRPNAIRIPNALPVIVERPLFDEVQHIISSHKQVGAKAGYACSGLVWCGHCGAKMHGISPVKNGVRYTYFYCSGKCGAPLIPMALVDEAAEKYLRNLLCPENQREISLQLRRFQEGVISNAANYNASIKAQIAEKQKRYDTLMHNLTTTVFTPAVASEIGKELQSIKDEIAALRQAPPPRDFTVDQIVSWLSSLRASPDAASFHLLISRIDVYTRSDIRISSTLSDILGETGWGSRI